MISQMVGIYTEASIFSWIGDMLSEKSLAAIGAVLMFYLGYIIKKEILPILKIKRNREMAAHILVIADDVTDYFRLKFPNAHWSVWLDKAVDRIIDITGVGRDVAGRAARASVARKDVPKIEK
ncbi:MAG: hypothetical protein JSU85_10615 [Candidatus Zixiibacteriota bacterium]|nr:MAG: hypothetical protein JSU85_10615 [candidate division Zixibacteria bacterium]